jgi:hypothetical protein
MALAPQITAALSVPLLLDEFDDFNVDHPGARNGPLAWSLLCEPPERRKPACTYMVNIGY